MLQNPFPGPVDCYAEGIEGDLMTCVTDDMAAATSGQALLGVLVGSAIIASMYVASNGDPAPPTITTILIGSALVPMLPGSYAAIAYAIVVLGIAFGVMTIGRKYIFQ